MTELLGYIKKRVAWLRRTPFHPQWLIHSHLAAVWVARHSRGLVLDIGCADRWPERCMPEHCSYLALDYPATGKLLYRAKPDLYGSASALPLKDACFDTTLFLEVAEHLADPDRAFAEIARVMKPGGQLLMSVPFLYPIHDAPYDYQRYTAHGLTRSLEVAGLRVEALEPTLTSAESSGMLACLMLAGTAVATIRKRHPGMLLVPLLLLAIPVVNLSAFALARMVPDWSAFTAGYRIRARRPAT